MGWTLPTGALAGFLLLVVAGTARADDLRTVPFTSLKFRDLDNASSYKRPPGLEVIFTGATIEHNAVVAHGFIENRTAASLELTLQSPQLFLLSLPPNPSLRPPPPSNLPRIPETFPWPRAFEIPAQSRVAWSAEQSLAGYAWTGAPTIDANWTVVVWGEANGQGVFGTARVQLPQCS
jgi:hypothetical protein